MEKVASTGHLLVIQESGGTRCNGLDEEALPKRGTFSRHPVHERGWDFIS